MDPRVNQEWTAFEIEEARSLIASLSNNGDHHEDGNDDKNKKHNDIVDVLHVWFPWKTMQQVTSLYVDLVVEMHMMKWQEENSAIDAHDVCPTSGDMNDNFVMPEAEEQEAMGNERFLFDCPLSEEIGTMKMDETPAVEENKMEMLENQAVHQPPPVAPHTGRYWTTEEHRLFLHGLRVYGRGDWKNISKYFVTTRTPVQVSSHAQKYFRRLESSASGRQRYSINDVGLHDADPWMMENSWEALAFAGGHLNPALGQAPASSFVTTNNLAQLWSPLLYCPQASQPAWSEQQQMVVSASAPMEGAGNFVPDGRQGAYLPAEQWMNNMH